MKRALHAALLGLAAATGCSSNCSKSDSALKQPKTVTKLAYPVQVAPLEVRQLRYTVMAPGSLDAFQQVQITARVAGPIDNVQFREGADVQEGQILAVIDQERYNVAVGQAKAAVDKAVATEQSAEAELARRTSANQQNQGLIPGEEVAQYQTAVATAKSDVQAAQENLRAAQINSRDSSVRAPIKGVIQSRTVQRGQYVQPGAVLGTLLQRDPLLLRFPVTEQDAPRLKVGDIATMNMRESARTYTAKILLVADAADPTTRLVPVTAEVDDTEHKYWLRPGAFCDVSIPIGDARPAIVVPTISVQPTEKGNVVYVIDDKNITHLKQVTLGMHTPDGGVEVTQGLQAGELLVVRGFEPLSEGAPVKVTDKISLEVATQQSTDAGAADAVTAPSSSARAAASAPHKQGSP